MGQEAGCHTLVAYHAEAQARSAEDMLGKRTREVGCHVEGMAAEPGDELGKTSEASCRRGCEEPWKRSRQHRHHAPMWSDTLAYHYGSAVQDTSEVRANGSEDAATEARYVVAGQGYTAKASGIDGDSTEVEEDPVEVVEGYSSRQASRPEV